MTRPSAIEASDLWKQDGTLRDVYVQGASASDWLALLVVGKRYTQKYFFNGAELPLPTLHDIFANSNGSHLLTFAVGGARLNCHFFVPTAIELDIDPREVRSAETHAQILEFLEALAEAIAKAVSIAAENMPEQPHATYEPGSATWIVHQPK